MSNRYTWDSQEWLPDAAVEALNMEMIVEPELTDAERARRILERATPLAAKSVVWVALNSANESLRLRASQYIIDGIVGGNFAAAGGVEDDLLMQLVANLDLNDDKPQPVRFE